MFRTSWNIHLRESFRRWSAIAFQASDMHISSNSRPTSYGKGPAKRYGRRKQGRALQWRIVQSSRPHSLIFQLCNPNPRWSHWQFRLRFWNRQNSLQMPRDPAELAVVTRRLCRGGIFANGRSMHCCLNLWSEKWCKESDDDTGAFPYSIISPDTRKTGQHNNYVDPWILPMVTGWGHSRLHIAV